VTGERTQAYGHVVKALDDLSASKLHSGEQQIVREAADALFFCEDVGSDPVAEQALADFYTLVDRLTEGGRLLPETGDRLTASVEACRPLVPAG